jgi:hypothetical protein
VFAAVAALPFFFFFFGFLSLVEGSGSASLITEGVGDEFTTSAGSSGSAAVGAVE